jgi:hypothetical protein
MTVLDHERLQESLKQRNHYLAAAVTEARGAVHTLRDPTFETLARALSALAASVALVAEALQCDVLGEGLTIPLAVAAATRRAYYQLQPED